jgi:putative membrane protein
VLHSDARGDVAQLEEHRVRIAGVRGSSPLISTIHDTIGEPDGRGPTSVVATLLVALVALIHAYILVLEMFLWRTPRGRAAFGTTEEQAETMATLAANQGLYNGFLAAGLALSLILPEPTAFAFKAFFLACVIIAGVYGATTVSRRILVVQAAPAALALVAVLLAR